MTFDYGISRVITPKFVLPTSAWELDNSRKVGPHEARIQLTKIHIEGTAFKQICNEANDNEEKIKQKIIDIVIRRGKLHNPVTNTGGMAIGIMEEMGTAYFPPNGKEIRVGDDVVINASIASIPIHIEKVLSIDYVFNQIEVVGYAIVHDRISILPRDVSVPDKALMFIMDESGTVFKLHNLLTDQQKCLIVGNNMLTNIIYGYVVRRKLGYACEITCLMDKRGEIDFESGNMNTLVKKLFDEVYVKDIFKPINCIEKFNLESAYDMSINCAVIPGAETINLMATKPGGTVLFANLINNLNTALYITEGISKGLNIESAEGYLDGYADFDNLIAKELSEYLQDIKLFRKDPGDPAFIENAPGAYGKELYENSLLEDFVYKSKPMRNVINEIMRVAKYDCNVIVFGDTGVGKEKVSNLIQKNSERKMQPFIKINCGAISPNLIESEFFGYEKGAFTGASSSGKKGYFELANNGVMFLDEIGELPLDMQAKLLRVIQDGEFYRVGGTAPVKTNVRIISATNRNLEKMVNEGSFRRDLYYRLNVIAINIPCLADRKEDIAPLVQSFLKKYSERFGIRRGISESAMDYLEQQPWPGNIRELENTVQRLMISAEGDEITLMDVIKETHGDMFGESGFDTDENDSEELETDAMDLDSVVEEYEKGLIKYALEKHGSTRKAAKALNISQTQLIRKKKKYNL